MKLPQAKQLPSGNWRCRVTIDGSIYSITRDTEKEAIADAIAIKARKQLGKKRNEKVTLRDAIDKDIESRQNLSPSTIRGYNEISRNRFQAYMDKDIYKMSEDQYLSGSPRKLL